VRAAARRATVRAQAAATEVSGSVLHLQASANASYALMQ
jgi:hypothetical protein